MMRSVNAQSIMGIYMILGFLFLYCYLVIVAVNKCFSMIWLIPDRVVRFIGAADHQLGEESQTVHGVQGALTRGGGELGQAAGRLAALRGGGSDPMGEMNQKMDTLIGKLGNGGGGGGGGGSSGGGGATGIELGSAKGGTMERDEPTS